MFICYAHGWSDHQKLCPVCLSTIADATVEHSSIYQSESEKFLKLKAFVEELRDAATIIEKNYSDSSPSLVASDVRKQAEKILKEVE